MPKQASSHHSATLPALASAALFGAATPAAKALLGEVAPVLLAGLFYFGSGLALSLWVLARNYLAPLKAKEMVARADLGWLGVAIFFGGVAAPLLLFTGLASNPASTTALLLNMEGVFTILLAWAVFREQLDRRLLFGIIAIVAGCALIGWRGPPAAGSSWLDSMAIVGACLAWAIDNNVTRKISAGDAVSIGALKGLVAGSITLTLGLTTGAPLPGFAVIAAAILVGVVGYGQSLVLFVSSLRNLGAARTAAYFSIAPFVGALLSIVFLGEQVSATLVVGGLLVGAGVWLHLTENHAHEHRHPGPAPNRPREDDRQRVQEHGPTIHSHPHYPDIHHRHRH